MEHYETFQEAVWEYYREHGRHDLPWRVVRSDDTVNPYHVLVSEIMLQQTQVSRVVLKFSTFITEFPTIEALATAPLADVLRHWSGLGYNRRAKFLWQTAGEIVRTHSGVVPRTIEELVRLPGVGVNTAGAILTYAYNMPVPFIETNIRTVFIYHFFVDREEVDDREIVDLVAATIPDDPRSWYWALMDYGTHLKQTVGNLNKLSRHYTTQSVFAGSRRQIRGTVLRMLSAGSHTAATLALAIPDERLMPVLDDLVAEGMVNRTVEGYKLPGA